MGVLLGLLGRVGGVSGGCRVVGGSGGGRVGRWAWWDLGRWARRGGGLKGVGAGLGARRVGGPKGGGAPKFRAFFSLSRHKIRSFCVSLGVFSWNFSGVLEAPGPSNVRVWSSLVVVCEPRRPGLGGAAGFHTTTREPKRAHLRVPVFKNTTKIQRKGPTREGERNEKTVAGEGKKRAKFWAVRRRVVRRRAVRRRAVRWRAVRRRGVQQRGGPAEGRVRRRGGPGEGEGRSGGGGGVVRSCPHLAKPHLAKKI